ncbi:MAG: Coenzyme F420 hydrogenase/dehydrogenase, beta subunit C-terminal domain [Spirochaetes bacterium]|nr:Coenzyme F420 hydrogenase/dehydrogenase, beta subunit C-terminal domain [Spirochaetota bacterium]
MNAAGPNELRAEVFEKDLCIGCGACVSLCPYFKNYNGKTAMLFPCTQEEGRCFAYCPKVEVDLDAVSRNMYGEPYSMDPIGRYRSVMKSRAGKMVTRADFQAGGTVTALMTYALAANKIDAAVLTGRDGLLPIPAVVTEPNAVAGFASSKYTSAPTLAAFNQAVREGRRNLGLVLTPCQALALAQMRANPMKQKEFVDPVSFVAGLFCTWALDYRSLRDFLVEKTDIKKIQKFDIPPPPAGVMEVYTESGKIDIPIDEIRKRVPNSCDYCFDMTAEFTDVSVGVFEDSTAWNTLVIRTERGQAMVDGAVKDGYLEIGEMPEENLAHLKLAAGNKKKRALERGRGQGMVKTAKEGGRAAIRIDGDIAGMA